MELIAVRCNHCGAPLQMPADAQFVTCMFCKSELSVQRSEGAISTALLQGISEKTDRIADDLGVLRVQGELELLDREWQMKRETLLVRNRRGILVEPKGQMILIGCLVVFFASPFIGWTIGAVMPNGNLAMIIGFFLVAFLVIRWMRTQRQLSPYRVALGEYERRHAELTQRLAQQSRAK